MAKFKAKIFFTMSLSAFALASLILTVFNNNPFHSTSGVFVIFYTSLFVTIFGISTILIIFIKRRTTENIQPEVFWPAARVSLLVAAIVTILLLLRGLRVLDIWVGVPLTMAILMLELFFRGNKYKAQ